MKYIYKLTFIILMAISLVGCYEDKGNYDLVDVKPIKIELGEDVETFIVLGETIKIDPIITYEDGTPINESDYTYKWTLDLEEQEGWDTKKFEWTPNALTASNKNLTLNVFDKKTGITYSRNLQCQVSSLYDKLGYLVLAERAGKSELNYVTIEVDYATNPNYFLIKNVEINKGVYKHINGEDLGSKPIKLHEHFLGNGSTKGQQLIIQESGCLDVVGTSFQKVIGLEQAFLDGSLPVGATIKNAMFMYYVNILSDDKGHLYTRIKSTNKLFHSNYFLTTPISYQGEVLTECTPIFSTFGHQKFALIHDNKNKRLLGILDGTTIDDGNPLIEAGRVIDIPATPFDAADIPEGFVPLDNLDGYEVKYIGFYRNPDVYGMNGYTMVLEKNGEYFVQQFCISRAFGNLFTLINCSFEKMNGVVGTPTKYYQFPYVGNSHDLFVAIGNKLYIYDSNNPDDPLSLYLTFKGNVVSINNDVFFASNAGVGLDNGQFLIINTKKAINVPEEYKILYESPIGVFEKIIDVKMRFGSID